MEATTLNCWIAYSGFKLLNRPPSVIQFGIVPILLSFFFFKFSDSLRNNQKFRKVNRLVKHMSASSTAGKWAEK